MTFDECTRSSQSDVCSFFPYLHHPRKSWIFLFLFLATVARAENPNPTPDSSEHNFDLAIDFGAPIYRTSGLSQFGSTLIGFGLEGSYFFSNLFGASFTAMFESLGSGNATTYQALSGQAVQGSLDQVDVVIKLL